MSSANSEKKFLKLNGFNFLFTVKCLVIDKADCYSFWQLSEYCIVDSPTTPVYIVKVLTSTLVRVYLAVVLLSILVCANSTLGLIFALFTSRLVSRIRIFEIVLLSTRQNESFERTSLILTSTPLIKN